MVRVVTEDNEVIRSSPDAPYLSPPLAETLEFAGFRVESRPVKVEPVGGVGFVQYARRLSDVEATANRVRFFLGLGVLGGTALALLAGVATARRAMTPIAELTETARTIERTRDPSRRIPHPEARGRGGRARADAGRDAPRAGPGALGDRGDAGTPARVRRGRVARAAHPPDVGAREP